MDTYYFLKFVHVVSATLVFGTGLGTAFHMWFSYKSGNVQAMAVASRNTVRADWLFTAPAIVTQFVTGVLLIQVTGFPWTSPWLMVAYGLFAVAGAAWIPVVVIQIRLKELAAKAADQGRPVPDQYHRYMRSWFLLGWPAFISVVTIFYLMIAKPW